MLVKNHLPILLKRYHRFVFGYVAIAVIFFALLLILPNLIPQGLSSQEMQSVIASHQITLPSFKSPFELGFSVVDLPYHLLQKLSLQLFGFNTYAIKLPSAIIAVFTSLLIVVLLNRWFKSNVAIVGSAFTLLSSAFLFLASSGTPAIMYVFYLTLLVWAGAKAFASPTPSLAVLSLLGATLGLMLYTPQLSLLIVGLASAVFLRPDLLNIFKAWPTKLKCALVFSFLFFALPLLAAGFFRPTLFYDLVFPPKLNFHAFITNIASAFAPFFSFSLAYDSIYLAPLFGLATVALVFVGIIASSTLVFSTRNSVISLLVIFAIIASGFNPLVAISIVLPIAILTTTGFEYILNRWHSLFPTNVYAHFIGTVPVVILVSMISISGFAHFLAGYNYTPRVVKNFNTDLSLINAHLNKGSLLFLSKTNPDYPFFALLASYQNFHVISALRDLPQDATELSVLTKTKADLTAEPDFDRLQDFRLKKLLTSPKSQNSARIFIYQKLEKQGD